MIRDDKLHLCLFASRIIPKGEEIRYSYDERGNFPWRIKTKGARKAVNQVVEALNATQSEYQA